MNQVILNLQVACDSLCGLPHKLTFIRWLKIILYSYHNRKTEITIRLVDENESCALNTQYRNKNYPTNILSFPFTPPTNIKTPLLGDLVICRQIVENEAHKQKKNLELHWAHIVTHGVLHLLGYNHLSNKETKNMNMMEQKIINKLGYHNTNYKKSK
ncbi:rRNA maturation RNase YbeY [Blochmannia endosymbiont of Camponotus (Colobopsis) obliquus]|uniref:rRNA maturation RNase YbeY n=1 Tax=Blochmannia endosymbiont of Camponotus (Colobopsis) obliquus TaxID=1505597 RepID=UPI00061A6FE7|nr:rRNA maturation RNase YbeY [Blochmannia endosymbiont of Camponotus (Colobopsis) obliquus]AKC60482.1 putative rRNA maturation factor YbeY [Blochmannia endosymbiont of Camponotus (Colobopsis) obliquus]